MIGRRIPPHRFVEDGRGAAAIEFALVLPVLLILCLGMFEAAGVINTDMKLANATQLVSDLVAQQGNQTASLSADFCDGGRIAMAPLSGTPLKLAIASVTHGNSGIAVDWQDTTCGGNAISNAASLATPVVPNVGDSVIVVVASYQYTSPVAYMMKPLFTLTHSSLSRPRDVPNVTHG